MVHALERASELVKPAGQVVVVHDSLIPPFVEIQQGRTSEIAGWLKDDDRFPMIRKADDAVAKVVDGGILSLLRWRVFAYRTHFDSLEGFKAWLDKQWETTTDPQAILNRVERSFRRHGRETVAFAYRQAGIRSFRVE